MEWQVFNQLSAKFSDILRTISGKAAISEKNVQDAVEKIKIALLEADVNLRVVRRFVNSTLRDATDERVLRSITPGQQFTKIVYDKMVALLGDGTPTLDLKGPDRVSVVLLAGLQGSGKTTTAAKLALRLKKEGRSPLLVAADLLRPAATEQLLTLGEQINVPVYHEYEAKRSVSVAKNALQEAQKKQYDTLIVDTSGRMHVDADLMHELTSIHASLRPVETLLVVDSMTGQHAVDIAKGFSEAVDLSGMILSKFDSDTRGGAALSLKSITHKPVKFIGVGEKATDLEPFIPERIAGRILGMGDMLSLVEKAQEVAEVNEHHTMQKKGFTLEDYLHQFNQMKKMGGLEKIIDFLPSMQGKMELTEDQEKKIVQQEAIILSMTRKERQNHLIIGPSRRKRIAHGSGRPVYEVNKLLKEFEKVRLMMKKAGKNKKYQQQMLQHLGV